MVSRAGPSAQIHEIFPSFQGEGPLVGSLQTFVRFAGCDRLCRYCDTPDSREFRGEKTRVDLGGGKRWQRPNPWSVDDLLAILPDIGDLPLWLTGGEPLLQAEFLARFLPRLDAGVPVGLETNACAPKALRGIVDRLAWVSADAKLPSVTGEALDWDAFADFLAVAKGHGLYVKAVLSDDVEEEELRRLFALVHDTDPAALLILLPVTPRAGVSPPSVAFLHDLVREGRKRLDVRVIPQVHRLAGWA